ncbi:winged helix-turn-helix transcriptional regulator [Paenibacillus lemnae]|uniref:Helix-turn-helix transcriptional regulator n=1 Tax=Paenibacillus lemnae TaxID=1330551 RepID=A0A848M480_PAELE|nr:helix-turn-helix domain-containing protein [Paenibacillus lemnae]NMO94474.1 helix-turn-helix transcriptional regulator [Paenibacillus lemnae]
MSSETYYSGIINYGCPIAITNDIMGGKWKGVILYHLCTGDRRFNELRRLLPNITQRVLTVQLREMERDGLILREVLDGSPPPVHYSLTPLGESLKPIIYLMRDWGRTHKDVLPNPRIQLP